MSMECDGLIWMYGGYQMCKRFDKLRPEWVTWQASKPLYQPYFGRKFHFDSRIKLREIQCDALTSS